MNTNDIEKLLNLIQQTDITEIEYQIKDEKIKITRSLTPVTQQAQVLHQMPQRILSQQTTINEPVKELDPEPENSNLTEIKAPLVGTFYRSPSPNSDPFVSKGSEVKKGDTLCIIEAMKLMNEIEAEQDGKIKEILIKNGTPVGFGEILFLIEPK